MSSGKQPAQHLGHRILVPFLFFFAKKAMTEFLLIRPCSTEFDQDDRVQGTIDLPLCPDGQAQLQMLLLNLDSLVPQRFGSNGHSRLNRIYTAPNEPAKSVAGKIAERFGWKLKELDGLSNLDLGLWQGLRKKEIQRKFPKAYRKWLENPDQMVPPEGEPLDDAWKRVSKSLQKPLRKKTPFVVVAPEPMATLISAFLRSENPAEMNLSHAPIEKEGDGSLVEIVQPANESQLDPLSELPH